MLSMTGYGKAEYAKDGINLVVEIKTVNNRNLDFNSKTPRLFMAFEDKIRKTVSSFILRGRVDLFITLNDTREKPVKLDLNLEKAKEYYRISKTLSESLGLENDCTISQIMRLPDVVTDNTIASGEEFEEIILQTVKSACENLNSMRKIEGERLLEDFLLRMQVIENLRSQIKERAPLVVIEHTEKLTERIKTALGEVNYDETRLLNEVAFYTDRVNIDEELTRLSSHIEQFKKMIKSEGAGKKLDFLMQEFNREANTICSKSNDVKVTELALLLKNEIEKVREQVQNIE